jgi:uncharacterized protein YqhQ
VPGVFLIFHGSSNCFKISARLCPSRKLIHVKLHYRCKQNSNISFLIFIIIYSSCLTVYSVTVERVNNLSDP